MFTTGVRNGPKPLLAPANGWMHRLDGLCHEITYFDTLRAYHLRGQDFTYLDKSTGEDLDRPGLEELPEDIFRGENETIVIWRLGRLSRTTKRPVCSQHDAMPAKGAHSHPSVAAQAEARQGPLPAPSTTPYIGLHAQVHRDRRVVRRAGVRNCHRGRTTI